MTVVEKLCEDEGCSQQRMPSCAVNDADVHHLHAMIDSTGWVLYSPEDVIFHVDEMLKAAYELGRKDQRDDFKERMGLK